MASNHPAEKHPQYACKCLNVHIISFQSPASDLEDPRDPAYTPVFVNDDGIVITHPQVTVRTTTHAEPIPGTPRYSRFTVLTCLLCRLPIYRVFQTISLEVQGKESILLPTDDWVEHDILKSATGWIQVHRDSIVGDSIYQAKLSPSYAQSFSLLLPPSSSPLSSRTSSPKMDTDTSPSHSTEPPAQNYLSELRPLFFPPPFTPSHPIFVYLASIAHKESQELRGAAEQRIADFVKAETAGIDAREQKLKHQVEVLWREYRDHLSTIRQEPGQQMPNVARSPMSRNGGFGPGGLGVPMSSSSSVTVRNFDPMPISPSALSPSSSVPRVSALSVSLATSTFHHSNANDSRSRSPAYSPGSYGSASSRTLSAHSRSSTLVPDANPVVGSNVLQFKRNISDTINTQASFRYFVNLEEDIARHKRNQEEAMKEQQAAEAVKRAQQVGTSQAASGTKTNGKLKPMTVQAGRLQTPTEDGGARHEETTSPRGRDKGKRKVTFDVEPAVMTIKTEEDEKVEEDATAEPDPREMIFILEDMEGEEDTGDLSDIRHNILPLLEQPAPRPLRPRKMRPQNNTDTFSSLRPSSLPNPSHIRPMRGQPHVDSSQGVMLSRPKVLSTFTPSGSPPTPLQHVSSPTTTSDHDAELLRLVAADTPSHRGAWTPNSRAWQTFTRRQDSKENLGHSKILEEGEETDGMNPVPPAETEGQPTDQDYDDASDSQPPIYGSAPISIAVRNRPHSPLSLTSYRPKTTIPNQLRSPNGDVPPLFQGQKMASSASIRKARYAERDRSRSMDPGALDFAAGEDEDDAEEEAEADHTTFEMPVSGERARKHALKILKARSGVPEAGMWRSLA